MKVGDALSLSKDVNGVELALPYRVEFGEPIFEKVLLTDQIRRAMRNSES
jgi:hypothetical protein